MELIRGRSHLPRLVAASGTVGGLRLLNMEEEAQVWRTCGWPKGPSALPLSVLAPAPQGSLDLATFIKALQWRSYLTVICLSATLEAPALLRYGLAAVGDPPQVTHR